MDIKDLKNIKTIADTESFSKAAEALFISQPALSQAIKRLEQELGLTLFFRDRSRVIPTEAGEHLIKKAIPILSAFEELQRELTQFNHLEHSTISLGISQFYGHHMLSNALAAFKDYHDDLHVNIVEGESHFLERQIILGHLDLGIFPTPIYSSQLVAIPIVKEEILLAINEKNTKALALAQSLSQQNEPISLEGFSDFPFILLKPHLKLRTLVNAICEEHHFTPKAILETENLDTCYSLTRENYGLTLLPNTIRKNKSDSSIHFFRIQSKLNMRDLVIVALPEMASRLQLKEIAGVMAKKY